VSGLRFSMVQEEGWRLGAVGCGGTARSGGAGRWEEGDAGQLGCVDQVARCADGPVQKFKGKEKFLEKPSGPGGVGLAQEKN
jgi:hypothetical protein